MLEKGKMAVLVVGKCWRWQKRISGGKGKIVLARSGEIVKRKRRLV